MPARFWNRGHLAQSNQANAGSDWFVNLTELICWFNLWASAAGLSSHLVEDISPRRGKCTLSSTDEFGSQPHTGLGHAICCHAGGPDTGRHTNTHTQTTFFSDFQRFRQGNWHLCNLTQNSTACAQNSYHSKISRRKQHLALTPLHVLDRGL